MKFIQYFYPATNLPAETILMLKFNLGRVFILFFFLCPVFCPGQDRMAGLETQLRALSKKSPGLLETVEVSVNNATIQEFMRGLANTHSLNISVEPGLNFTVSNSFSNVSVIDVLLFICKHYDLDIVFTGPIMSFVKHVPPPVEVARPEPHLPDVSYDKVRDMLNMDLRNDTLFQVARQITIASGKNVVVLPAINNKIVNGYVQDMSFGSGLLSFAMANGLQVAAEDSVFVIGPAEMEPAAKSRQDNSKAVRQPGKKVNGLEWKSWRIPY
jgi:type IV pilus assembly protein PilQ